LNVLKKWRCSQLKSLLHLDKLDLEFIMGVQDHLERSFNKKATEILLNSSFLDRLKEDPVYVYHYDEHYWAQVIKQEYESNQVTTTS
jgi:hypothetical protein